MGLRPGNGSVRVHLDANRRKDHKEAMTLKLAKLTRFLALAATSARRYRNRLNLGRQLGCGATFSCRPL
jgi:hypothetical protein